jgi:hypothetical protein
MWREPAQPGVRLGSRPSDATVAMAPMCYAGSTSMSGHTHQSHAAPARSVADGPSSNPNRRVRSWFSSPERRKFETCAGSAPRNLLKFCTSHNLTKMAVVQLRQRKRPPRASKRPETGSPAGASGSEASAQSPAFPGVSGVVRALKKNVSTRRLGGPRGTVVEHSLCYISMT